MGKMLNYLLLILLFITGVSCNTPSGKPEQANMLATFQIEGMVCEMGCAGMIEKELAKVDGIVKAEVFFSENTARILFSENKITGEEIFSKVASLDGERFKVSDLKVAPLPSDGSIPGEKKSTGSAHDGNADNVVFRPLAFPDVFQNLRKIF